MSVSVSRLRPEIHIRMAASLPSESAGYARDESERYRIIRDAGYESVQGGDASLCRQHGLRFSRLVRINDPVEIHETARLHRQEGSDYTVLHAGWGTEPDSFLDACAEVIIGTAEDLKYPILLETHRATITQDNWRTIQWIERHPELRFNLDFSHYYTGHEMTNGPWDAKIEYLQPLLERADALHGRIGNSGSIQTRLPERESREGVHFRAVWTHAMRSFCRRHPGDALPFTLELLPPEINYARTFLSGGRIAEESDRWLDGLELLNWARECFEQARTSIEYPA